MTQFTGSGFELVGGRDSGEPKNKILLYLVVAQVSQELQKRFACDKKKVFQPSEAPFGAK